MALSTLSRLGKNTVDRARQAWHTKHRYAQGEAHSGVEEAQGGMVTGRHGRVLSAWLLAAQQLSPACSEHERARRPDGYAASNPHCTPL